MIDLVAIVLCIGTFFGTLTAMRRFGPYPTIAWAWFGALLLMPSWTTIFLNSLRFDPATAAGLAILIGMLREPIDPHRRGRFVLLDAIVMLLALSPCVTHLYYAEFLPLTAPEAVRAWVLPYIVGRVFIDRPERIAGVLPVVCVLGSLLALYGLVESVTKINLVTTVLNKHWENLDAGEGYRWGLKRAQAFTTHPIYLSFLLVLLLPWALEAGRQARMGFGRYWWRLTPGLFIAAIIGTVSRSGQLATLAVLAATFFHAFPRVRGLILVAALASGAVFFMAKDEIIATLSKYAGEADADTTPVLINGIRYPYSGTKHRELLAVVYEEAIEKNGPFGYGRMMDHQMPVDPEMDKRFRSMDDHYLVQFLQYGHLGVAVFVLFGVTAGLYLWAEGMADTPYAPLAFGLCGAFVSVGALMKGVSLEPDYGWMWIFTAGFAARLRAWRTSTTLADL